MALASYFLIGKLVETIGAGTLAYVGVKIALFQCFIGRHFHRKAPSECPDLETVRVMLAELTEFRRKQFGTQEALLVAIGTIFVTIGCLVYLIGLWQEH